METVETFTLDTSSDEDILLFLAQQKDRSAVIRTALRNYMRDQGVTLSDILSAIQALRESPAEIPDQPEEAVANLMQMLAVAES